MGSERTEDLVPAIDRRAVVTGAGVVAAAVVLGGCQTYGGKPPAASAPAAAGTPLAKTSEIPVGGGKIFKEQDTVVTQATTGQFTGLSATCTHQGCIVATVAEGTINCECHGSKYNLDGSVANGPAPSPLPKKNITVQGEQITLA
jgi:Rieske Fe-S protein